MGSVAIKTETEQVYKSNCTLCVNCCGINVYVQTGRIVRIEGMPEHPLNRGVLCPKGQAFLDWQYSPARLLHPLKRIGGELRQVSWDEALDTIVTKLKEVRERYGPHALGVRTARFGENRENHALAERFTHAFGTERIGLNICFSDLTKGRLATFGRLPFEEPDEARCLILWGTNPTHSNHSKERRLLEAVGKGAQLIVINPRRIPLSQHGLHVGIRPGTDLALALGLLQVIISEGLYDKEFVAKYCHGFERLAEHVRTFTPDRVSQLTWVPAEDIVKVARLFATHGPSCIIQSTSALGHNPQGFQVARALSSLQAITGNVYKAGTWVRVPYPPLPLEEEGARPLKPGENPAYYSIWKRVWGGENVYLPDAVLEDKPYPIRAAIFAGCDVALSQPDSRRYREALRRLDLLVVLDYRLSETGKLAHVVLPAATSLESLGIGFTYPVVNGIPYISLRPKVVEPPEDCRTEFDIWTALGRRMGYGQHFPWETEEEFVNWQLQGLKVTADDLRRYPSGGFFYAQTRYGEEALARSPFPTPSGKIELYSEALGYYGYGALPTYADVPQPPPEYPFIMVSGARNAEYSGSQFREISRIRRRVPEPRAEMHPQTARAAGVADGDMVAVETRLGSVRMRARVTEDLVPGIVDVPHNWAQANVNELTDAEVRDPVTGIPNLKAVFCRVRQSPP